MPTTPGTRRRRSSIRLAARATSVAACSIALLLAASRAVYGKVASEVGDGAVAAYAAACEAEAYAALDVPTPPPASMDLASRLLESEGEVPAGVMAAASSALSLAPEEVLRRLGDLGWRVVVTSERDLGGYAEIPGGGEPVGVCVWEDKAIYMKATLAAASGTTLHEVSHWIDRDAGWISSTEEWMEAYAAESETYAEASRYAATDAREMLAEVCNDVLLGRSANMRLAPRCTALAEEQLRKYGLERTGE